MKKALLIILTLCLLLALAACGGTGDSEGGTPSGSTPSGGSNTPSGDAPSTGDGGTPTAGGGTLDVPSVPGSTVGGGGKALVVYYSATDHTERVAQIIADTLGADTFELEPVE